MNGNHKISNATGYIIKLLKTIRKSAFLFNKKIGSYSSAKLKAATNIKLMKPKIKTKWRHKGNKTVHLMSTLVLKDYAEWRGFISLNYGMVRHCFFPNIKTTTWNCGSAIKRKLWSYKLFWNYQADAYLNLCLIILRLLSIRVRKLLSTHFVFRSNCRSLIKCKYRSLCLSNRLFWITTVARLYFTMGKKTCLHYSNLMHNQMKRRSAHTRWATKYRIYLSTLASMLLSGSKIKVLNYWELTTWAM